MSNLLLCRICAQTSNVSESSVNLFDTENAKLLRLIKKLTGKVLENYIHLPQKICEKCLEDLQQANAFRVRCNTVQYYFTTTHYNERLKKTLAQNEKVVNEPENEFDEFSDMQNDDSKDSTNQSNCDDAKTDELEKEIAKYDFRTMESDDDDAVKFICDQCGKGFRRQAYYQVHLKRHNGEKSYQCIYCPKRFVTKGELTAHHRYHTREAPYPCRFCDKRCIDSTGRRKHEMSHSNERPFPCLECNKKFKDKIHLKTHMLTHSGDNAFKCMQCSWSFKRKSMLKSHYEMHEKEFEDSLELHEIELLNYSKLLP